MARGAEREERKRVGWVGRAVEHWYLYFGGV